MRGLLVGTVQRSTGTHHAVIVVLAGVVAFFSSAYAGDLESTMFPAVWGCGFQQGWTLADLNNDGLRDMVAVSDGSGVCSRLGNGDGTFVLADEVGATERHSALLTAELGLGRFKDLASVDKLSNSIRVYPGLGAGAFGSGSSWAVGDRPQSLAVGDLDGDGDLDVVTGNSGSDDVSVLLQTPTGFAREVRHTTGHQPIAVALGFLDSDPHLDLVVANPARETGLSESPPSMRSRNLSTSRIALSRFSISMRMESSTLSSLRITAIGGSPVSGTERSSRESSSRVGRWVTSTATAIWTS